MSEDLPVSVHILTFNSARTLARTIESVHGCKEILVLDGGSTDDTRAIAQKYGAHMIEQQTKEKQGTPLTNFAEARNRGLRESNEPWILALDSDEYASLSLMNELRMVMQEHTPCACWIPRKYVTAGNRIVTHATTYPNERLYFFHRNTVTQWIKPVHEKPEVKPDAPVRHLKGGSVAPLGSVAEYKRKNLRYLAIECEKDTRKGWGHWFIHRLLHTLRSRCIALLKLLWIWCIPRKNFVPLPLNH